MLNHTGADAVAPLAGTDLLADEGPARHWTVPAGGVRVLREAAG
ncbi:hypothetical protein [Streptomonospora arabica]|uniref:Uncharacterized protein n=1 Tax=Streptomonospora arabica TaxID=412417 RepID=A0ABV9SFS5_9ACTN